MDVALEIHRDPERTKRWILDPRTWIETTLRKGRPAMRSAIATLALGGMLTLGSFATPTQAQGVNIGIGVGNPYGGGFSLGYSNYGYGYGLPGYGYSSYYAPVVPAPVIVRPRVYPYSGGFGYGGYGGYYRGYGGYRHGGYYGGHHGGYYGGHHGGYRHHR